MSKAVVEAESLLLGYKKLSNQVYVLQPSRQRAAAGADASPGDATDPSHPTTVVIYGWGDARPRHVAKYADGYRRLFPHARIVLVFSPILKALYQTLDARARSMLPVIEAVYPREEALEEKPAGEKSQDDANDAPTATGSTTKTASTPARERVLLHVMSNTGGINFAATMYAYAKQAGAGSGHVFPHDMLVCDSTPGSTNFLPNVGPWSRAMALGAARWFPWPFVVTQALAALFLGCLHGFGWLVGATSAAEFSRRAANDPNFTDASAKRLYLYSKEDDIIHWEDIEEHAAEARQKGWNVSAEVFDGTPHVGHMRGHPDQYWAAISAAWKEAVGRKED